MRENKIRGSKCGEEGKAGTARCQITKKWKQNKTDNNRKNKSNKRGERNDQH